MPDLSSDNITKIGDELKINWDIISPETLKQGITVELEHGSKLGRDTNITNDDLLITGKIALAHLKEDPFYYDRLNQMEKEADKYWEGKNKPWPTLIQGGFAALATPLNKILLIISIIVLVLIIIVWLVEGYGERFMPFSDWVI